VCQLANRGKIDQARAALAKFPNGKELHVRLIENTVKAMEDMLLERGGVGTVWRILDQFFEGLIIRTALSEHF
jgi:hypothetical protein